VNIVLGRPQSVASFFVVMALVVGSWSLGDNMRTRRAYLAQLEERARRLEREQEETAQRAVEEERTRIARELHDVVAHHISAIAVQAGAGAEIAERDPPRAREVLHFIQETSRGALAEMRAMLNMLHSRSESGTDRAPQPSLAQVERLLNQSRAAGLPVTLRVEGDARPLPEALDLSAYRIVQEALTNILKHAGPARSPANPLHTGRAGARDQRRWPEPAERVRHYGCGARSGGHARARGPLRWRAGRGAGRGSWLYRPRALAVGDI
jgi:signal transduction histidine kinase